MSATATYIRKIAPGQFEYGFVLPHDTFRRPNFRKRPDVYAPVGVAQSVAAAESARSDLEARSD